MKPNPASRKRLLEALFWVAVVMVGLFVLLPAVVELIEARRMEDTAQSRSDLAGEEMLEEHNRIKWIVDDSEGVKKLAEQQRIVPHNASSPRERDSSSDPKVP